MMFEQEVTNDLRIFRSATKLKRRDCKGSTFVDIGEGPDLIDLAYTDWSQHSIIKKQNGYYN